MDVGARRPVPAVAFAGGGNVKDTGVKDTIVNAEETGEFVINIATYAQRERMREIEAYLGQCWDLLRQSRAKRTAGLDPEAANVRDVETVEHYDQ